MTKIKKMTITLGTVASITAPIVTTISCGSDDAASSLNPKGTLTIARWGNDVESASQQVAIDAFKKANPGVNIKVLTLDYGKRIEQISKWAASGSLPDIIETDGADYSAYAESQIIKKLDTAQIDSSTLSGLIPQSLGTMVGNVTKDKWSYGTVPSSVSSSTLTGGASLWGVPKEFNTLGTYVNKEAYDFTKDPSALSVTGFAPTAHTYDAVKAAWEGLAPANKTNSNLHKILSFYFKKGTAQTETHAKGGHQMGPLSFTNDPNRFTQLFSDNDYNTFKGYSAAEIKTHAADLKTSLKKWYPSLEEQYKNLNQANGALTSQGHGYGWNGEAFDKKGVGAVIEGAWFTPSADIYTDTTKWDIWTAPTPGLFPQGWALTAGSNDDSTAYKFMSYMASEKGSKEETSLTGANPVNKNAFVAQYNWAKTTSAKATATAKEKATSKKILAHAGAFINDGASPTFNASASARPLLFTSEYPAFQKAWNDTFADKLTAPVANQTAFDGIIDTVVDTWVHALDDMA